MFLTVLANRTNIPSRLLEDWDTFVAQQSARETEAGRSVTIVEDPRTAQRNIELARSLGREPRQEDLDVRTPNYPATIAQYALLAATEHANCIKQKLGNAVQHADALQAWLLAAKVGKTAQGTREELGRRVAVAQQLSQKVIRNARRERRLQRRRAS